MLGDPLATRIRTNCGGGISGMYCRSLAARPPGVKKVSSLVYWEIFVLACLWCWSLRDGDSTGLVRTAINGVLDYLSMHVTWLGVRYEGRLDVGTECDLWRQHQWYESLVVLAVRPRLRPRRLFSSSSDDPFAVYDRRNGLPGS